MIYPFSLFGFNERNWCGKNQQLEKVSNSLLPISMGMYAQQYNVPIQVCDSHGRLSQLQKDCFMKDALFETEVPHTHTSFQNAPPHDVRATHLNVSMFYESKIVMWKKHRTELILRQDCYAFNALQHQLLHNVNHAFPNARSLLSTDNLIEQPYLWVLLWKKRTDGSIMLDMIVFTDVAVLRMIENANTERSRQAIRLIDRSLWEYVSTGVMTYKHNKSSTVPHQKVSLFPFRDLHMLRSHNFEFRVRSTDVILRHVRTDTHFWQEVEKTVLHEKIRCLTQELERLKNERICGESQ